MINSNFHHFHALAMLVHAQHLQIVYLHKFFANETLQEELLWLVNAISITLALDRKKKV